MNRSFGGRRGRIERVNGRIKFHFFFFFFGMAVLEFHWGEGGRITLL